MNPRLTIVTAVAVVASSVSLFTVIMGAGWLYAGIGAVAVVAAAGLATRMAPVPAAVVAAVLTLVAVAPLLTTPGYLARIIAVALLAAVAASAGVRRLLPVLAGAVTYLAALLIYLNLAFAASRSAAWIVPTTRSLRYLGNQAMSGYQEHNYAPPVPGVRGLELIAAAGIGLTAILADLIAVRLRSPAVAGLPLLVLFSVPVATNVKHADVALTLSFCLGITGYLAMLAADGRQRLRLWGRLVTVWQDPADDEHGRGPDTRQLAASGRRVGLAAVAFAIFLPLILPSLHEHGIFGRSAGPGHGGDAQVPPPDPLVEMASQLQDRSVEPVLSYRTTATNPPEQYLQVYVLNYDAPAGKWTLVGRGQTTSVGTQMLQAPPGLSADTTYNTPQTTITIDKDNGYRDYLSYLPIPYAPETLKLPGTGWQETDKTLMVYGYHADAGMRYTVTSKVPEVIQSQLPTKYKLPASLEPYLTYPGPDRTKLLAIAKSVAGHAGTPFKQALALENWFTAPGRFTYSLRGNLPRTLYQFLTTDRIGFCQQFAFGMAVLARLLGIPSRIAVGYTAGTYSRHGVWKVTTADAHAWPELYFPTVGWIRFEPTPGGPTAQGTATRPNYPSSVPATAPPGIISPQPVTPDPGHSSNPASVFDKLHQPGAGGTGGSSRHAGSSSGFPAGLTVGLLLLLLIASPGLARVVVRRRRWLAATGDAGLARAAWLELTSMLTDFGLSGPPSESPRAISRRVADTAHLDEDARAALRRISAAEERARYATTPAAAETLPADVQTVRRAIASDASRGQRWRARLFPPSTLAPVLAGLRQAPDVFGWLDAASLRLRHSLPHPRRAT
jgi:transglutaminase-like putative cysteine protease